MKITVKCLRKNLQLSLVLLWFASSAFAQSNTAPFDTGGTSSSLEITLRRSSGSGVTHAVIEGSSLPSPTGYFEIDGAGPLPIGSQVSFKAQAPMLSGRIYAEVRAPSTVGVAFSNPNAVPSVLSFFFTDSDGRDIGFGTTTISPNGQIARFLDQPPFNAPAGLRGSMSFTSTAPVAAIAVLGYLNERGVFLMPQDPVLELPNAGHAIIPYFIAGSVAGGNTSGDVKTTDIVILNTTDQPLSGTFTFFGQGSGSTEALPVNITIEGQTASTFSYSIPTRASTPVVLPHLPSGFQSYVTRIRVFRASSTQATTGVIRFFSQAGDPIDPNTLQ